MHDIIYGFSLFGVVHLVVVIATVAGSIWAVRRRRRLPTDLARLTFDRQLAVFALVVAIINHLSEFIPGRYDIYRSLPIHICDFVGIAAALAILTRQRLWRVMLYYWGLGLSTQAVITPELQFGPASFTFWVFWVPHAMIVVLAIYDLAALRYRPGWKDYLIAVGTLLVYLAVILPINLWLNVNYGFIGQGVPGQASVIDFLGPWPLRVFKLVFAVLVFLALMTLPWSVARRVSARRSRDRLPLADAGDDEMQQEGQGGTRDSVAGLP